MKYSEYATRGQIHNTSFSLKVMNFPDKLEFYMDKHSSLFQVMNKWMIVNTAPSPQVTFFQAE